MNSEFAGNALRPIKPENIDWADNDTSTVFDNNQPLPKTLAEMVLGYEPTNRHDRRKAAKLLKSKERS